jgi:hypothetical protein
MLNKTNKVIVEKYYESNSYTIYAGLNITEFVLDFIYQCDYET